MIVLVFFLNIAFIILARRSRLQTMTMIFGPAVILSALFFLIKTILSFLNGDWELVIFKYARLIRKDSDPKEIPLITFNVGFITGILALTFCFQEESVSLLNATEEDKEKTKVKLNKGYLMVGLFMLSNVVFGGIGYSSANNKPEGFTPFSLSDFYIGKSTLERVLLSAVSFAQLLPMVPLYSLKTAAFVELILPSLPRSPTKMATNLFGQKSS